MNSSFENIIYQLFCQEDAPILQANQEFNQSKNESQKLNAAFLICLSGESNPIFVEAQNYLNNQGKQLSMAIIRNIFFRNIINSRFRRIKVFNYV